VLYGTGTCVRSSYNKSERRATHDGWTLAGRHRSHHRGASHRAIIASHRAAAPRAIAIDAAGWAWAWGAV